MFHVFDLPATIDYLHFPLSKYIALERLESIYKSCNLVLNICVHATPDAKQPIAIIIPHEQNLRVALKEAGNPLADADMHEICASREVAGIVLKSCNANGKKNGFKSLELLQDVVLTADEWTPESGLVNCCAKGAEEESRRCFRERDFGA